MGVHIISGSVTWMITCTTSGELFLGIDEAIQQDIICSHQQAQAYTFLMQQNSIMIKFIGRNKIQREMYGSKSKKNEP